MPIIKSASNTFEIDWQVLASIIFVERTSNYDWKDTALDELFAQAGLNSSIGFCQVKLKTAYWIEVVLNDSNCLFHPNKKINHTLDLSPRVDDLIEKLVEDTTNIYYAAAYLRIIQSRWDSMGFSIDDRPDIIGTLYSTGLFNRNGGERPPNNNPKSNDFGKRVLRCYAKNLFTKD